MTVCAGRLTVAVPPPLTGIATFIAGNVMLTGCVAGTVHPLHSIRMAMAAEIMPKQV